MRTSVARMFVGAVVFVAMAAGCSRAPARGGAEMPAASGTEATAAAAGRSDGSGAPDCHKLGESAPASANGLEAYVSMFHCGDPDVRDLLINVRVWNVSDHPVRFFRMPTWYPMLVFEVRRAGGETIPTGPPPVPPERSDDCWLELAPDQDYLFDASVGSVVAVDLGPGDYELRFAYENADDSGGTWVGKLETGWVGFAATGL